jgi:hypothetical protein
MNSQLPTISLKAALKTVVARCALSLVLGAGFLANAQSTNDSNTTDYDSFQIIVQRNIFDPDRYPHRSRIRSEVPGVPTFSLAGTMSYRKGMFAFFSGTSDDYQKVLQQGGTIAGYTVAKITFDGVQLQTAVTNIDMKVGAAMRLEGSDWELSEPGEWGVSSSSTEAQSGNQSGNQNTDANSTPAPSPDSAPNDVLKRLMQLRQQELK